MKRRVMAAAFGALAVFDVASPCRVAAAQFAPPTGIYSLGRGRDVPGSAGDERVANIRDYDFVSGYTLRLWWRDIEPTPGVYDLDVISEVFTEVAPLGQRINLEILDEPPDYVVDLASATYTNHRGGLRPVPWDAFGQSRRAALQQALADYAVDDGLGFALHEHPTLAAVSVEPMGLNYGVRDLNDGLVTHPDYTRQRFMDAVVDGVAANSAAFPHHEGSLLFFSFNDDESPEGSGPSGRVDKQLIELLDAQYNGPGQPRLSFFVENLSDNGPNAQPNGVGTGGNLREWSERGGGTMMQALDSWVDPPANRVEQLASGNPATGISLAYDQYETRFFELYIRDLDPAAEGALDAAGRPLADDLLAWNTLLTSSAALVGDYNGDAVVDARDFLTWREGSPSADGNDDGVVDRRDYDLWRIALGSESAASVAVPEPVVTLLASFALLSFVACGRNRSALCKAVAPSPSGGTFSG